MAPGLDFDDPKALFACVFDALAPEVVVYPSENYYYYILHVQGREIWGNLRLPIEKRDEDLLGFGWFEQREEPNAPRSGTNGSCFFGTDDGVVVTKQSDFRYTVRYNGKTVVFHLHQIPQHPPALFGLDDDELFVARTLDESGYSFFLLFDKSHHCFFWVLNEEHPPADTLVPAREDHDLLIGKRSGFAFLVDRAHNDRKILMAIDLGNRIRNNYYDGPFDQLADNYADITNVGNLMIDADPTLAGRVDKYGRLLDRNDGARVALAPYYAYTSRSALMRFLRQAKAAEDVRSFISIRGPAMSGR